MKSIIVLILLFLTKTAFGQDINLDSLIAEKIDSFKILKIDTFAILERKCESMIPPKCGYVNFFLIWNYKGQAYIQLVNKCETENIILDTTEYFFKFYTDNRQTIESEKVKIYETEDGGFSMIDHYCESVITIYERDNITKKVINSYFLELGEGKHRNINYEYNNSLKIVELDKNARKIFRSLFN